MHSSSDFVSYRVNMASADELDVDGKVAAFAADLLRIGCVKGFKFVSFYIKGPEELLVSIKNEIINATPLMSPGNSFLTHLPRNHQSLMLSARTQQSLSGLGYINVGLPPASPSEREVFEDDPTTTAFLLAAYSKYKCPYVWVRSNHERLVRLGGADDKDSPLKLRSTADWATEDIQLWDIVGELVDLCAEPAPINPFAVDFGYFESLPRAEAMIASGAMISMLQRIVQQGKYRAHGPILRDLKLLYKAHFKSLWAISHLGLLGGEEGEAPTLIE
eukprot:m.13190 g.13190  ORF g.13190 m.13190 type:complete len:275 (+) comp5911_c1_seq1:2-826(+)